jgi:hypothetical protein
LKRILFLSLPNFLPKVAPFLGMIPILNKKQAEKYPSLRAKRGNPEVKKHLSSLNIPHYQYLFLFWIWYDTIQKLY